MTRTFTLILSLLISIAATAQNFTGQWKGSFGDNSSGFVGFGGDKIEYVLDLETHGNTVGGYSYTYFVEGGKRYYTICKLKGRIDRAKKEVIVTEVERTKYNTPHDFRNCFQTHRLTYRKNSEELEALEGTWVPAPDQDGDCGYGRTYLTRRLLKKSVPFQNNNAVTRTNPRTNNNLYRDLNQKQQNQRQQNTSPKTPAIKSPVPLVKTKPEQKKVNPQAKHDNTKPAIKEEKTLLKEEKTKSSDIVSKEQDSRTPDARNDHKMTSPSLKFEHRTNKVLKTIEVEKKTITVDLYDNGEIDGDTVSVFFNGKLLVASKKLSDKPLSLKLEVEEDKDNELTMYAENLGSIPPNTALMVVKDGDTRYEVRITSDNQKNGTIAFVHKAR
jgi:hypothetical protein